MGNVGLSGLGARKKSRVLRTEPEGIAKIRRQRWESNQEWAGGVKEVDKKKKKNNNKEV